MVLYQHVRPATIKTQLKIELHKKQVCENVIFNRLFVTNQLMN